MAQRHSILLKFMAPKTKTVWELSNFNLKFFATKRWIFPRPHGVPVVFCPKTEDNGLIAVVRII